MFDPQRSIQRSRRVADDPRWGAAYREGRHAASWDLAIECLAAMSRPTHRDPAPVIDLAARRPQAPRRRGSV